MRTFTLFFSAMVLSATAIRAQTVADFESLPLPATDTYYVNYSAFGTDVGFNSGLAHFPCIYDTSFGYTFVNGFVYSNKTDSVTNGFVNQFSAKTAIGYGGSAKYAVLYCSDPVTYQNQFGMKLIGAAVGHKVNGFYATNGTYTYNAIMPGYPAQFPARKFDSGDWFKLTVKGYLAGVQKPATVNFYLADFRSPDSILHYAIKAWQWVDLLPLGNVDSIQFSLSSSDTGSFGMNTPAYFCLDNFKTDETNVGVNTIPAIAAKVYPNPATDKLYIDIADNSVKQIVITDVAGNTVSTTGANDDHIEINTATLSPGVYMLHLQGSNGTATVKFVKQ